MKLITYLCIVFISIHAHALSGQAYYKRFMAYSEWNQHFPEKPEQDFLAFIDSDTPLAKKLRERFLYQLARKKDWKNYSLHYKKTQDVNLQCFAHLADYYQGKEEQALAAAKPLWLTGFSQPGACGALFELLQKSANFDERLITQRIILALKANNSSLAHYLLNYYQQPRKNDALQLSLIDKNPMYITQLNKSELKADLYLYGLEQMVSFNTKQAILYWQRPYTQQLLSPHQRQSFITYVALYKAMHNHDDAAAWFAEVKPRYYNDMLLDWQIRSALIQEDWQQIAHLVPYIQDKDNAGWQYWLARAQEQLGKTQQANSIYEKLAATRNYYGFLASVRLNKTLIFQNEQPVNNHAILKPYQPVTSMIKTLYNRHQEVEASRLLNDFMSELPKNDKSALIHWIATELHWYSKSLYLSSTDELSNQLSLRFPLAYQDAVTSYSKHYQVSPELVYAIIRQESGFKEDATSSAGACGLMQLMPSTANMVAHQKKIAYTNKSQLFTSQKNINIGVAYLQHLTKRFDQHPLLIAAAYNAGPSQVIRWLKTHPPKQIDIWIETLPWRETRNYLKNVMSFYAVYQYRMQHKPTLAAFMTLFADHNKSG